MVVGGVFGGAFGTLAGAMGGIALTGESSTPAAVMFVSIPVVQLATTVTLARRMR